MTLIDPDTVEPVNLAAQGYAACDLGRPKVQATAWLCAQLNPQVTLTPVQDRFKRSSVDGTASSQQAYFCCVDSIRTRELIWQAVGEQARFFADGRMSGEVIRVLAAGDATSREHYPSTLFSQSEAFTGRCTSRSTIYTANIAAGLMIAQFARHLRGMPVEPDVLLDLAEPVCHGPA